MIIDTETCEILHSQHYPNGVTLLVLKYINMEYESCRLLYGHKQVVRYFHGNDQDALGAFQRLCANEEAVTGNQ